MLVGKWPIEHRPSAHHEPCLTLQIIMDALSFLGSLFLPWRVLAYVLDLKDESRARIANILHCGIPLMCLLGALNSSRTLVQG